MSATTPATTANPHTIDFLGVKALRSGHPAVRRLKRLQQGYNSAHGNKVWRSSFVLMDYLSSQPPTQNSKVLDIGCGWGLTGIFLAKTYGAQVTGIDIDESVAPFLALQADVNNSEIRFEARGFESLSKQELRSYSTLIGTDICFWDELTEPLFDLIKLAISAGVERIILADPGRPPFWDLVDKVVSQLSAEVVTRRIYQPWKTEKYILVITGP